MIRDGLIAHVGQPHDFSGTIHDLGPVALVPGLVNAHTHLEFSDLDQPLGHPGIPFTDWILHVVQNRAQQPVDAQARLKQKSAALRAGIEESAAAGVVGIGEIASSPFHCGLYRKILDQCGRDSLLINVFLEQLGRDLEQLDARLRQLDTELSNFPRDDQVSIGLSPHAPYSVHPELLSSMVGIAQQQHLTVAMHLAETKAELQLLAQRDGPFVDALKKLRAWFPESYPMGESVIDVLKQMNGVERLLIVHANYFDDSALDYLSTRDKATSVVYCPRTADYFGHLDHPFPKMIERGINVAVGTDSRASNPDLDVFAELQWIRERYPKFCPETILRMGTINGASALGRESEIGSITNGKRAWLNVIDIANYAADPFAAVLSAESRCLPINQWLAENRSGEC